MAGSIDLNKHEDYVPNIEFWQLLHSLIRHGDKPNEVRRSREVCAWMLDELSTFRRVCIGPELLYIDIIKQHYSRWIDAPTYVAFYQDVEATSNQELIELLEEYDNVKGEINRLDKLDIRGTLLQKAERTRERQTEILLRNAAHINSTGATKRNGKNKVTLKGPDDAMRYVIAGMEADGMGVAGTKSHGVLQESASEILDHYEQIKAQDVSKRRIKTGIAGIDDIISFRKGNYVGILGYTGQRKSSLARTWLYNAALNGLNSLHMTYEQSYIEELVFYGIMHSHHEKFANRHKISVKRYHEGGLTADEERFLFRTVIPDLEQNVPGKIHIKQPVDGGTWESVKVQAQLTHKTSPIDMLLMDYLTLCPTKSGRKEEMEEIIKDAKRFSLQFDNSAGLLFITPVQSNRDGYLRAEKNDGQFDTQAIFEYSEFDKSLDVCMSTFYNDECKANGKVIISSCKSRWSDNIKPFEAGIDSHVGRISDWRTQSVSAETISEAIEDL